MIPTRHIAGAIVVGSKDLIVVVKQKGDSWSLPKGGIEPGEDAKTAARREIQEETGLTQVKFIKELGTYQRYKISHGGESEDQKALRVITLFLCSTDEDKLAPEDPDNPEARWTQANKVADILTHPKDKEYYLSVLPQVRDFIKSNLS
jgi:ADP-ribose pyrophosphatase YjhB (NUDIX family)